MTSDKDKGTIVQVLDFSLFAEYFQFYIQDAETDETLPVHWEPEDEDALALVASEVIAVRTVRETDVPISIEILDTKPSDDEDLTDWDHVIECTLELPAGRLLVTATSEDVYESRRVELEPGNHGLRIYWGGLTSVDAEGFEGDDHYKIRIWKIAGDEDPPVFQILKQWEPPRPLIGP